MKIFYIAILLSYFIQTISIQINSCAKWERKGTTEIGTGVPGDSPRQLNEPVGISIHDPTNALYIADHRNARIQMFYLNESFRDGITVATNLLLPLHIFVDDDNNKPTMYVTLSIQKRIEKWIYGASQGEQIGDDCNDCVAVAVDNNKNVYITDTLGHCVLKWSVDTNKTSVVAGKKNEPNSTANRLSLPQGLYVTRAGDTIYISDSGNSRIQKWPINAQQGVTVAGLKNGTASNDSSALQYPIGVFVDETTNIVYVADRENHRVTRWLPNTSKGDTIAGFGGQGNSSDQLNEPSDLAFDKNGNLYVSDLRNHRIQLFRLIDNQLCSSSSTIIISYKIISNLIIISIISKTIWLQ